MKAILFAGIALGVTLVSCSDEMDYKEYILNTREYIDTQNFNAVTSSANNVYNYLDYDFGQNYGGGMLASATDEAVFSVNSGNVNNFFNGSWSATNTMTNRWDKDYTGIQCANYYIDHFSGLTFDDYIAGGSTYDDNMLAYEVSFYEVRALRAYYFLDLVKNFGDVPYFTHETTIEQVNSLVPSPAIDVLDSIMAECDSIVNSIPADHTTLVINAKEYLRVDKFFVLALKARAALYAASPLFNKDMDNERWLVAAKANKEAIDICEKEGKKGFGDYKEIASAFSLESKELIFSRVLYPVTDATLEKYNYPVGIQGSGAGGNCPSQTLVDAYEMQATGLSIFEEGSGYDESNPYAGRDPRLALTVACNGDIWPTAYVDTINNSYSLETFIGGASGAPVVGASPTGYYLKKGLDGQVDLRSGSSGIKTTKHSWTLFRLGELYLNFAEAAFRYAGDANTPVEGMSANEAVNKIRARAKMPNFPSDLAGDEWMKKYKNERFVELAFEGHRFYDLRRWKGDSDGVDAEHVMTQVGLMTISKNENGDFTYTRESRKRSWDNKMYFFPIAKSELLRNPNLKQNAGWE